MSRSWFCVYNNPCEHDERLKDRTPNEILEILKNDWINLESDTSGAWAYCISADGLHHVHMVLERSCNMRFSWIKSRYCIGMHIDATRGNKRQVEDYINKRGKFEEKGETVVCILTEGEIKGNQGKRNDLEEIENLLNSGKTPNEIMREKFSYRRYESMIKKAYYDKRYKDTPIVRDVAVHWLFGATGTGKSYKYFELCQKYGEDNVYRVTDYEHSWDNYNAEPILFLDEFRGGIQYGQLLLALDVYKCELSARYSNCKALWSSVYIASPLLPQEIYINLAQNDSLNQLYRRINDYTYHYIDDNKYITYTYANEDKKMVSRDYIVCLAKKEKAETSANVSTFGKNIIERAKDNNIPCSIIS